MSGRFRSGNIDNLLQSGGYLSLLSNIHQKGRRRYNTTKRRRRRRKQRGRGMKKKKSW